MRNKVIYVYEKKGNLVKFQIKIVFTNYTSFREFEIRNVIRYQKQDGDYIVHRNTEIRMVTPQSTVVLVYRTIILA